eukprot:11302-Heterococcus_DN1.PRE.2
MQWSATSEESSAHTLSGALSSALQRQHFTPVAAVCSVHLMCNRIQQRSALTQSATYRTQRTGTYVESVVSSHVTKLNVGLPLRCVRDTYATATGLELQLRMHKLYWPLPLVDDDDEEEYDEKTREEANQMTALEKAAHERVRASHSNIDYSSIVSAPAMMRVMQIA